MAQVKSDALVFYGATGDLAYKKIFPALHLMVKRGNLNSPIIGVARGDYDLEKLRARAKESIQKYGQYDEESFGKFYNLLGFVGGAAHDTRNKAANTAPIEPLKPDLRFTIV